MLQNDVESSVRINSVTSLTQESDALDHSIVRTEKPEQTSRQPETEVRSNKKMQQYAEEQIVGHVTTKFGLHYVVHWYVYSSSREAVDSPKRYSKHFVDACYTRKQRDYISSKRKKNDGNRGCGTRPAKSDNQRRAPRIAKKSFQLSTATVKWDSYPYDITKTKPPDPPLLYS